MRANIVLVGPSGAGKSFIGERLCHDFNLAKSISWTTRPKRLGDREADYKFVTLEEFKKKADSGGFIEWNRVHEYLYGTPWLTQCKKYLFILDPEGALVLKRKLAELKAFAPVRIFFVDAEDEVIRRRLIARDGSLDRMDTLEWFRGYKNHPAMEGVVWNSGRTGVSTVVGFIEGMARIAEECHVLAG